MHKRYSSGSSWEAAIGYSRAIQAGNTLYVSATASSGPDGTIIGNDLYTQTTRAAATATPRCSARCRGSWSGIGCCAKG